MKLFETKCPSCKGKLLLMNTAAHLYRCEYCGNQYIIEKNNGKTKITVYDNRSYNGHYENSSYNNNGNHNTNYNNSTTKSITKNVTPQTSEKGSPARRILVRLGIGFCVSLAGLVIMPHEKASTNTVGKVYLMPESKAVPHGFESTEAAVAEAEPSDMYQSLVKDMFGRAYTSVTEAELSSVTYLTIYGNLDERVVEYSFDDPYGNEKPLIHQVLIKEEEWDSTDVLRFSGLVRIDLGYSMKKEMDLSGLTSLKGIVCHGLEFSELSDMVADPSQILELNMDSASSLDGMTSFGNLTQLSLDSIENCDLKELVHLKHLKTLTLQDIDVSDFSPVKVAGSLESLEIKSEALKDIQFVKDLPSLAALSLQGTSVFSLEPLAGKESLQSLTLDGNYKLTDYQPVQSLSGLKELVINKDTSNPDPDLTSLGQLEKLDISGFMSLGVIRNLQGLKELSIHSCNVDEADVLSSLSGVERLTFYSVWTYEQQLENLNFIEGMTNLKYANFCGSRFREDSLDFLNALTVYGDISSVFRLSQLEELYLDNGQFEINFDRIGDLPSLRILSLNHVGLHKNYYVESYNGMTNVWYDDVKLQDQAGFLGHFPNLEELYLDENELTDLSFTASTPKLSKMSVQDNYITDLTPLVRLEYLTYLDITDNPVSSTEEIGSRIEIIQ